MVTCMSCKNPILHHAVYCGTCGLLLCPSCFAICSSICPYKSYTNIPVSKIEQVDDTTTLIKVKRPILPLTSLLQGEQDITTISTPKVVSAEKTVKNLRFIFQRSIYEFKPFTIRQLWISESTHFRLDPNIIVKPKGSFTEPWHPHVRMGSGELCLGSGDTKIQRRSSAESLAEYIKTNFVVFESVLRDFGVLGHGYNNPADCFGHWTIRLTPEPVERERIRIPIEALTPSAEVQITPTHRYRRRPVRPQLPDTTTEETHPATFYLSRTIGGWNYSRLLGIKETLSRLRVKAVSFTAPVRPLRSYITDLVRYDFANLGGEGDVNITQEAQRIVLERFTGNTPITLTNEFDARDSVIICPLPHSGVTKVVDINIGGNFHISPNTIVSSHRRGLKVLSASGITIGWIDTERRNVIIRYNIFTSGNPEFVRRVLDLAAMWWVVLHSE